MVRVLVPLCRLLPIRAEDIRVLSLSQGVSWIVQIGSRFHPIWPFLTPWLRFLAHLQWGLRLVSLEVRTCKVQVSPANTPRSCFSTSFCAWGTKYPETGSLVCCSRADVFEMPWSGR